MMRQSRCAFVCSCAPLCDCAFVCVSDPVCESVVQSLSLQQSQNTHTCSQTREHAHTTSQAARAAEEMRRTAKFDVEVDDLFEGEARGPSAVFNFDEDRRKQVGSFFILFCACVW